MSSNSYETGLHDTAQAHGRRTVAQASDEGVQGRIARRMGRGRMGIDPGVVVGAAGLDLDHGWRARLRIE